MLVQRFMLNLRQLDHTSAVGHSSDTPRLSRFSDSFRMPSDLLGNIGEPVDCGRYSENDFDGESESRGDAVAYVDDV